MTDTLKIQDHTGKHLDDIKLSSDVMKAIHGDPRMKSAITEDYVTWGGQMDTIIQEVLTRSNDFNLDDHDTRLFELCEWLYQNHSMVAAIVDGTIDALLPGNEDGQVYDISGPDPDLAKEVFFKTMAMGLDFKQDIIYRGLLTSGNAIFIVKREDNGDIANVIPTDLLSWSRIEGSPPNLTYVRGGNHLAALQSIQMGQPIDRKEERVKSDDIVHFRLSATPRSPWGVPYWKRVLRELQGIKNAHSDIAVIIKSYISPTRIAEINTDVSNGGVNYDETTRAQVVDLLGGFTPNKTGALPSWITLRVIESESRSVNIELYDKLENTILAISRYPRHLYLNVSNRSVSDNIEISFQQRINSLWRLVRNAWNDALVWPLIRQIRPDLPEEEVMRYSFKFLSPLSAASEQLRKAQMNQVLVTTGIKTSRQVAREEYGIPDEVYDLEQEKAVGDMTPGGTSLGGVIQPSDGPNEGDFGGGGDTTDDAERAVDALASGDIEQDPRKAPPIKSLDPTTIEWLNQMGRWHQKDRRIFKGPDEEE